MDERTARMCLAVWSNRVTPRWPRLSRPMVPNRCGGAHPTGADLPLARRARQVRPDEIVARSRDLLLRFVVPGDPQWPSRLADLAGCETVNQLSGEPLGVWLAGPGDLAELVEDSVAIVGSRASTAYGDTVASDLGAELSEAGRTVLSGGAYGIDAAAHRGCLAGRSPTIAVLAGGLDLPYPSGHRPLFDRIATTGVLVSELAPGEHPTRVRFLARNRLIAA